MFGKLGFSCYIMVFGYVGVYLWMCDFGNFGFYVLVVTGILGLILCCLCFVWEGFGLLDLDFLDILWNFWFSDFRDCL